MLVSEYEFNGKEKCDQLSSDFAELNLPWKPKKTIENYCYSNILTLNFWYDQNDDNVKNNFLYELYFHVDFWSNYVFKLRSGL